MGVRRVQVTFLIMLVVSSAQVIWWIVDQSLRGKVTKAHYEALYQADLEAARALAAYGESPAQLQARFPHLTVNDEGIELAPEALAALQDEHRGRLNQYAWEGSFFLFVLLAGIAVVWRAVSREAELRRWQNNFLAAVSHELKSPLASLQLAAETLDVRHTEPSQRKRIVSRILSDTERLSNTVAKILETHRLDLRAVRLHRQALNLRAVAVEVLAEQEFRTKEAGVEIHMDIPEQLALEADATVLRTVLRNLLDNALKATEKQGGKVWLSGRRQEGSVLLTVRDNGSGFPANEAERIFERFYRVGDELRRTRSGSGLGLYLTRRLVELDGGQVTAHSTGPGEGATFEVLWRQPMQAGQTMRSEQPVRSEQPTQSEQPASGRETVGEAHLNEAPRGATR